MEDVESERKKIYFCLRFRYDEIRWSFFFLFPVIDTGTNQALVGLGKAKKQKQCIPESSAPENKCATIRPS